MSGETKEYLEAAREKMSPEQRKLDEWIYDFTKDATWRGVMVLGYLQGEVVKDPSITFLQALQNAKNEISQTRNMELSPYIHQLVHIGLHRSMDELVADFFRHDPHPFGPGRRGLKSTIEDLLKWSYEQTIKPTEVRTTEA